MYTSTVKRAIALLLLPFVLAACGGNGGSSPNPPAGVRVLDFPGTLPNAQVTDFSHDATTVVGISDGHAFKWSYGGGFVDLGAAPNGTLVSLAVSGDGSTVGGTAQVGEGRKLALSSTGGTALAALDDQDSSVTKLSYDGTIAGGYRGPSTTPLGVSYYAQGIVKTDFPVMDMDADGGLWYFDGTTGALYRWTSNARPNPPTAQVTAVGSAVPFQVSGDGKTVLYVANGAIHLIKLASTTAVVDAALPEGFDADGAQVSYDGTAVVFPQGVYSGTTFSTVAEWLSAAGYSSDFAGWTNLTAIKLSRDGKSLMGKGVNPANETKYWIARSQ